MVLNIDEYRKIVHVADAKVWDKDFGGGGCCCIVVLIMSKRFGLLTVFLFVLVYSL